LFVVIPSDLIFVAILSDLIFVVILTLSEAEGEESLYFAFVFAVAVVFAAVVVLAFALLFVIP
jgi:hypothetical protein